MSHNKTQERLQAQGALRRAVSELGAVEVAPDKYAFSDHSGWYVANERGLIDCATVPVSEGPSEGDCVEMPSWWTPERQFAWRYTDDYGGPNPGRSFNEFCLVAVKSNDATMDASDELRPYAPSVVQAWIEDGDIERITASLEDGSEVPA